MEECLLAPHCGERHRATACEKFRELSLQHRQSVIAEKELCANWLRHSDLDESKKRDCIRRAAPPHWVSSSVKRPGKSPSQERELPQPVEAKAGMATYACRTDIMVRTKLDSQKEEFGASLAVLFSASRQMTGVVQAAAVEKGLPWRTVPEVTVMLGDGRREKSTTAEAAPELPLLRHRFINSRLALTMGVLSQKEGPIELVIARDYKKH
jgi:hypothetical protein